MEFSCCILPPRKPAAMREFVRLAADLGFDRFWLSDQTFHTDPFVMLMDASLQSTLPLGLALTNPFTRHPVQIARAIATLRHLVPRPDWVFALGASNPLHVLAPLGISLRNPATQASTAITVVRQLLAGESVTCNDPRVDFHLDGISLEIEPCDDVELYLGTRGPKMLEAGGRTADGVIVEALFTPNAIEWATSQIAQGRRQSALPNMPAYVAWQVTEVLDEGQPIPDHAVQFAKHLMSTTHESVLERVGFERTLIETVKGSGSEIVVPPWAVQQFAAMGTPAELIERIAAADEAGADSWSCSFTGTPQETAASMTRFAEQVMKPLRSQMVA